MPSKPGQRFEGYAAESETDKKILRDVFEKGDVWFRTGDLMRKDANGYFYFVDRIGDTFRWKGENVSTTEVEEALGQFAGILEANVYGVQFPGHDGRAGMAAVVARPNLNLTALHDHLAQHLPEYARPVFLRIREEIDVTATFKQKKIDLVQQGFDPQHRQATRSISTIRTARRSSASMRSSMRGSSPDRSGYDRRDARLAG